MMLIMTEYSRGVRKAAGITKEGIGMLALCITKAAFLSPELSGGWLLSI
jgi:hypothetical protein